MNPAKILLTLSACLSFGLACKKPAPSPQYGQASERWSALYREKFEDAYLDPEVDEILGLLGRVDDKSLDARFAKELTGRLQRGRDEARARAADREKLLSEARAPTTFHGSAGVPALAAATTGPAQPPEKAAVAEVSPVADQPRAGMSEADFTSKFSRCFEYKNDYITPTGGKGAVYGLRDLSLCRDLHREFLTSAVMVEAGKVQGVMSKDALTPKKYKQVNGQLVPYDEAAEADERRKAERAITEKAAAEKAAEEAVSTP
jgi:hypothetical protein